jgi:ABC-type uncharacterized transport system substrate-binding protein
MMVPRFVVLVMLTSSLLAASLAAGAQPAEKRFRVGVVCPVTCDVPPLQAFRQGMLERRYVEGRNITFEHRAAGGKFEKFPDLFAELVALGVDVIVASGGLPGALAAKRATTTIPVVFVGLGEDPVRSGLVESLARPGGNATGLVALYAVLVEKQLELITATVPGVSRVAALWDVGVEKALEPSFKSLAAAAGALRVRPQLVAVHGLNDFARAFRAAADARAGAHPLAVPDVLLGPGPVGTPRDGTQSARHLPIRGVCPGRGLDGVRAERDAHVRLRGRHR